MTEWILQQQVVLTTVLVLLVVSEHWLTPRLGVRLAYQLWWLVPVSLIVNNLPTQSIPVPSQTLTRFVVGIKPELAAETGNGLFVAWMIGAACLTVFVSLQYFRLWRSVNTVFSKADNAYYSALVSSPVLFGLRSPKILLPAHFSSLLSPRQQQLVIEHEQTHYRQRDHLWNTVAVMLAIVFWFNPLVWLALRSFRINQEQACDDKVLTNKSASEKLLYAKALVSCAEQPILNHHLYPTFGEKNTMLKRLTMIKQPAASSKLIAAAALAIATAFTANTALANLPDKPAMTAKANEATPVKRVAPIYPQQAMAQHQEGSVTLQFDITESGKTENIQVVASTPEGVFDASAAQALSQWEYKPRIQGGKAQRQSQLLVQLDFRLDN